MKGLVIGIPRQLMICRSGARELADRMNEESRTEGKRKDEAHHALLREIGAMTAEIERHGRHSAAQASPRLQTHSRRFGSGIPAIRPSAPSAPAPTAGPRSATVGGNAIDTVAVYRFRNHGVGPQAAASPTKATAPKTFGAVASRVYNGDAPSFLISSTARGGAA
jgi:hypothetical protein